MNVSLKQPAAPLKGHINPQSSKNYTTRNILASCLAEGQSTVWYPAVQDDAVALVRCCQRLGAKIEALTENGDSVPFEVENRNEIEKLIINGFDGKPVAPEDGTLDPDNAGAVLRMLIGVACLCEKPVTFLTEKYPHSLGRRPNIDLVEALRQYGIKVQSPNEEGTLPLTFSDGHRLLTHGSESGLHKIEISGSVSSQYLSSLLFMAPLLESDSEIRVINGLKSKPLIKTTLDVLKDAGINVSHSDNLEKFMVMGNQKYRAREWKVNGDWPGISAVLAAATVVPGSEISIARMQRDQQGEQNCIEFYKQMGCKLDWPESGDGHLTLKSPTEELFSGVIDGDRATDAVLAMMSAASCAVGESTFTGINNLQFKECDRVREPIHEMSKVFGTTITTGAKAAWSPIDNPETITVTGSPEGFTGGVTVEGHGDHRVIMLLSVMALRSKKPITIIGAEHVAKSYPGWFEVLEQLGVEITYQDS